VERTHTVLERAQDKRTEILEETEQQVIDLVLLIARKVIKTVSENQRTVVISNAAQALRKLKTAGGNVLIRVNLADIQLTT
jgi:flagellar assembly protein FliH